MSLALVHAVKAELITRGVDLRGPCGAFEITKRVAWALYLADATDNVGLVAKCQPQNGCYLFGANNGYGADVIMWPDGTHRDILIDGGGQNGPAWSELKPIDAGLWRAPIDPGDEVVPIPHPRSIPLPPVPPIPIPTPPSPPSPPPIDVTPLVNELRAVRAELTLIRAVLTDIHARQDRVLAGGNRPFSTLKLRPE